MFNIGNKLGNAASTFASIFSQGAGNALGFATSQADLQKTSNKVRQNASDLTDMYQKGMQKVGKFTIQNAIQTAGDSAVANAHQKKREVVKETVDALKQL